MKKVILIPDSFKGTMSSQEICGILGGVIKNFYPDCTVVSIPVADGGEGTVDAFLAALGGEKRFVTVQGPYGEDVQGFYGMVGGTAIVEMAAAAGLPLVGENKAAEKTSTYGVGQLIRAAVQDGAKKIILGLGGSATNDGGAGAAAALGVRFYDDSGKSFIPVGETLRDISRIDAAEAQELLKGTELVTMCDIDNPLCGESGAAAVFAPQKGADADTVKLLDDGLRHMAEVVERDLAVSILDLPGAGAAGGMGGGVVAFFGSQLKMGIEMVLEVVEFDKLLDDASLVLTGEGKIDGQSVRGKVVMGVAKQAKEKNVPVFAIVGDVGDGIESIYEQGITAVFSINRVAVPYSEAKKRAKKDLADTVENIFRAIKQFS